MRVTKHGLRRIKEEVSGMTDEEREVQKRRFWSLLDPYVEEARKDLAARRAAGEDI